MITIFIILFLVPCWAFGRFWSRMLHEYDLVLDSVADKTVENIVIKTFVI